MINNNAYNIVPSTQQILILTQSNQAVHPQMNVNMNIPQHVITQQHQNQVFYQIQPVQPVQPTTTTTTYLILPNNTNCISNGHNVVNYAANTNYNNHNHNHMISHNMNQNMIHNNINDNHIQQSTNHLLQNMTNTNNIKNIDNMNMNRNIQRFVVYLMFYMDNYGR